MQWTQDGISLILCKKERIKILWIHRKSYWRQWRLLYRYGEFIRSNQKLLRSNL